MSNRLYLIFQKIIDKMTSYRTYSNKLCSRFSEYREIEVSITKDSAFSTALGSIHVYGGLQRTACSATKTSNFSTGNITNITYATMELQNDDKENWRSCPIFARNLNSSSSGGLKSYYCTTANSSYAYRSFQVAAVVTADTSAAFDAGPVLCKYPSILS